jgi:hypothetical protein
MRRVLGAVPPALVFAAWLWSGPAWAGAFVADDRPRDTVENAFILWNPETKVQHLLLSVRLDIDGPFALWLPCPAPVEASVVSEDPTMALSSLIGAYRARTHQWELPSLPGGAPRDAIVFGGRDAIDVSTHDVGTRERALGLLERSGRADDRALRDYLERYVGGAAHVVEVRGNGVRGTFTSPYVHMRFETPRPWYPYREPAYAPRLNDDDRASRLLRVTVLTTEQVAVQHGRSLPTMAYAWLAFEPESEEVRRAFEPFANWLSVDGSKRLWLTSFEDRHAVRPGDDDWTFARAGDVPKRGLPGTIGDETKAGIVFEPLGSDARSNERVTDEPSRVATVRDVVRRRLRGRVLRGVIAFGSMGAIAAAAVFWLARQDGRQRRSKSSTQSREKQTRHHA